VAKVLAHCIKREVDFMARWGGEEFVALLQNTGSSEALNLAEQIRSTIEKTSIPCTNKKASNITVSIGVNTQIPTIDCDSDSLVLKADEALYHAKTTGRNKVVLWGQNHVSRET
jgi:diguanylate cyclase (GGDEF)-like protein